MDKPPKTWQKKKPPTEFEKQMGKRIRECRERLEMSTDELANALNLSPASIIQYELGVRSPAYDRFAEMASMLGVTTDYLLRGNVGSKPARDPEVDQLHKLFSELPARDRKLVIEFVKSFLKIPPMKPSQTEDIADELLP